MKKYVGTDVVYAEPMTRGDYNKYRGWSIPNDENPDDKGYLVERVDNHENWIPKETFEKIYTDLDNVLKKIITEE